MGWTLWALESLLAVAAAWALSTALLRERPTLERWMGALLIGSASILTCVQGLGLVGQLGRPQLAVAGLLLHGGLLAFALRRVGGAELLSRLRADVGAPPRLLRDIHQRQELAAWALVPAACAVIVSCSIIWHFPNWAWDVVWYHVPKTNYAVQTGSITWVETSVWYVNGYPELTELLSVWNVLLPRHTRLDDLSQVPFGVLGALAVAAWCRRASASPALSASLGAMWLALPAVALQLHTSHADVVAGSLFITAFYFLTERDWSPSARTLTLLAMGLYAGTKVSGLFHLALMSPLLLARGAEVLSRAKGRRGRVLGQTALALLLLLWLGAPTYVENVARTGNPFWPARMRVLGHELEGPIRAEDITGPPAFFGSPGAFRRMVDAWTAPEGMYWPDVRERAYGWLFPYLLLPALLWVSAFAVFSRERFLRLSLPLLAGLSVLVPAAWWGRFTLGLPAAGLVALAVLHRQLRTRYLQVPLSALAAFLSVASFAKAAVGYQVLPTMGRRAVPGLRDTDRVRERMGWLWPPHAARLREEELEPGDVVAYDNTTTFLGEYWTLDLRNRVEFVNHDGADDVYLDRLRALKPRWVSVGRDSPAERLLLDRAPVFERLFDCPSSGAVMYRVTRDDW
ncbi:hypothetical protein MYSTI_01004 [Myxococcus stipitatus DSM 14675]|uniref:Glycosyltransferase RgtA/B/C/D-like domain-containing protein n=1 Tax=Myxococcus stipitatus (strain DSM 14675 / JCM 12634 / Mx s8) TaxID=1278073 RepID=L7U2A7_MYXSD|nr:hypothetical protein [Myxococcus stipitatus]AGC42353.1 hypothetical protein MYSTI_01004 [Myxococcus stipitatus DSM 14675]